MMKIAFKTFGCKVNQYNTFLLEDNLARIGFEIVHQYSKADTLVINACVVTEKAEKECLRFVRSWQKSGKRVIITGCKPDFADLLNANTCLYFAEINEVFSFLQSLASPSPDQSFRFTLRSITERTRATVKIQSGCSQFCSYCIVPYRRGKLYSRSSDEILQEIGNLVNAGYKEVVMTGTQIGLFREENGSGLVDLLYRIEDRFHHVLERVRLSSISPSLVDTRFIHWMQHSTIACPHLHLSLQSGSNAVLQRMNRHYTREQYLDFCCQCRQIIPDFCISTDIIVGFPGETPQDFDDTLDIVQKVGFSKVHVFPFSVRPGTQAEKFNNKIPPEMIRKRTHQLLALSKSISYTIKRSYIGKELEVMIEGSNGGFTRNYLKVLVRPHHLFLPGDIVRVVPTDCNDEYLIE